MFVFWNDFHMGLQADGDIFGRYTLHIQQLDFRITHVAVQRQLFKVLHWPSEKHLQATVIFSMNGSILYTSQMGF